VSYLEFLLCTRGLRALAACAVHFVGRLRCLVDAIGPDSSRATWRLSGCRNPYGTVAWLCPWAPLENGFEGKAGAELYPGGVPAPFIILRDGDGISSRHACHDRLRSATADHPLWETVELL